MQRVAALAIPMCEMYAKGTYKTKFDLKAARDKKMKQEGIGHARAQTTSRQDTTGVKKRPAKEKFTPEHTKAAENTTNALKKPSVYADETESLLKRASTSVTADDSMRAPDSEKEQIERDPDQEALLCKCCLKRTCMVWFMFRNLVRPKTCAREADGVFQIKSTKFIFSTPFTFKIFPASRSDLFEYGFDYLSSVRLSLYYDSFGRDHVFTSYIFIHTLKCIISFALYVKQTHMSVDFSLADQSSAHLRRSCRPLLGIIDIDFQFPSSYAPPLHMYLHLILNRFLDLCLCATHTVPILVFILNFIGVPI